MVHMYVLGLGAGYWQMPVSMEQSKNHNYTIMHLYFCDRWNTTIFCGFCTVVENLTCDIG